MAFERLQGVGPKAGPASEQADLGGMSIVQRATAHRMQIRRKAAAEQPKKEESESEADEKEGDEGVEVSQEGDPAEQEADRVADEVVDAGEKDGEEKDGEEKDDQDVAAKPAAKVHA